LDSEPSSDPAASLALCREALPLAQTDEDRAFVHLWMAFALVSTGQLDDAIAATDQAAALQPTTGVRNAQARMRLLAERFDEALGFAEAGLRDAPESIELRSTRAELFIALGRGPEVIPDLERLHRERPDDIDLTVTLIDLLHDVGEAKKRDQILDRAIARAPDSADLRLARAALWMPTRPEATLRDLDRTIHQAPSGDAYALRAFARVATDDLDGARADLAAIPDPAALSFVPLIYASFAAEAASDLDDALVFAEHMVEGAAPSSLAGSLARRGRLLFLLADKARAKADLERAALLDPEVGEAWAGLAALALETDPAQAVLLYRRAVDISPDDAASEYGLTEALFWSGDYSGAAAGYASLLKRYPDDPEMHASLAATLVRLERVQDAERPSARAVALAPDNPEYRLIRGEVLYLLGEEDGALEQMDRLAAAGADTAYSRYVATVIRRNKGDYEAALREADAGLALAPDDADLMEEKGGVYYMLDDPLSALEWLDKALAINPRLPGALFVRGLVRGELGDAEGAAADQAAAIALDPALAEDL
jgi:tetratricopeptide (TPR) repeat protein